MLTSGLPRGGDWSRRVAAVRDRLVRRGHVGPVVAVATPEGRAVAGDAGERFEIGSVTKVLTAVLLADLADAGIVRLTSQVRELVPPRTLLAPGVGDVTLEELASHRSGLPRLPPGMGLRWWSPAALADPYATIDGDRLLAALARVRVGSRAARIRYSNLGVGLAGHLLGEASGDGYERVLMERVVGPLGMSATSFADLPLHQGRARSRPVGPWHLAALAGAGGLRSTASDLLTLLESVRDGGTPLDAAVRETLVVRGGARRLAVGLGWFLLDGGRVAIHDGGTLGARVQIRLDRETGVCAVVLGDGRGGTARAAAELLRPW